tara:strand:- start:547 stop:690 length:144 start_codon:yes stop_codon:yes gene_type:complete
MAAKSIMAYLYLTLIGFGFLSLTFIFDGFFKPTLIFGALLIRTFIAL